ncbi:MAG: hypothetical protein ACFFD8_05505 [Candidatus Thorarchaeota archaeon]
MAAAKQLFNAFEKYNLLKTFLLTLLLSIVFLYLFSWPGCILGAVLGGFFTIRYSRAAVIGFLAGLTAWGLLVGIHAIFGGIAVLDLFGALAGLEGMGSVLAIIIVLIGGLLGLGGSLLGNALFSIFEPYWRESAESSN